MGQRVGLVSSSHERQWWLFALGVVGGVLGAGIAGLLAAPRWVEAVCVVVGAVLGVAVPEVRGRRAQREQQAAHLRGLIAGASKELPLVGAVRPADAGVHPAVVSVEHVERDVEEDVAHALRERARVLLVGPAMGGKSHLALQVAQQLFADHAFLKPSDGKALHQLMANGYAPARVVVWLDRLDRFLADGLTREDLAAFCQGGTAVVATILDHEYEARLPSNGHTTPGWEILDWFAPQVWLPGWTPTELERAAGRVPAQVLGAARRYGLSAYLAGGRVATERFRAAESTRPEGHAVARAAADWRRVGRSAPVSREVLVEMLPAYLRDGVHGVADATQAGLDWATAEVAGTVPLLDKRGDGYEAADYLVVFVDQHGWPIPDQTWAAAARAVGTEQKLDVAFQAVRQDRPDAAEAAWHRLRHHPVAMFNLGVLADRRGDLEMAEHWWRMAAEAGDPGAMYRLGVLLLRRGSGDAAVEAQKWAAMSAKAAARPPTEKLAEVRVTSADARIAFGGAASEHQMTFLTAALRGYMAYLEGLDASLGPVPLVHIEPDSRMSYPDPARQRLFIGAWLTDDPGALLHEYSHWVLDSLVPAPRDAWTEDVKGVESGLAYYLPCSFMGSSRITRLDVKSTGAAPPWLHVEHQTGLRWAGALWEVREALGQEALDRQVVDAWRATPHPVANRGAFADRLCALLDGLVGRAGRQIAHAALTRRDLVGP